jgi:hypothetical protein
MCYLEFEQVQKNHFGWTVVHRELGNQLLLFSGGTGQAEEPGPES